MAWQYYLLLFSWLSLHCFAGDIVLYAPPNLSNNSLSIQLKSAFRDHGSIATNIKDVNSGNIIVGTGKEFLEVLPIDTNLYSVAVLPYSLGMKPGTNKYHQYFHVAPAVLSKFLSQQFKSIKVGFIYYDENDPFLDYISDSGYDNVKFTGRKATKDVYSSVRRLRKTDQIDIFLVTNDTRIYTSKVLRFLLEDLYRQNLPVVSLSKQLLSAGAAFALVPNLNDFALQTAIIACDIKLKKNTPYIQFAETFEVAVNEQLIKRFGISISKADKNGD